MADAIITRRTGAKFNKEIIDIWAVGKNSNDTNTSIRSS